jgi:hypothetical protein
MAEQRPNVLHGEPTRFRRLAFFLVASPSQTQMKALSLPFSRKISLFDSERTEVESYTLRPGWLNVRRDPRSSLKGLAMEV